MYSQSTYKHTGLALCIASQCTKHTGLALCIDTSFFFSRLISAVADWMSTILLHMVWPSVNLECRSEMCCMPLAEMQDPKSRQNSPSGHHRTTLSGYVFAIKARIDNRKKNLLSNHVPRNVLIIWHLRLRSVGAFGAPVQISTGFASWQHYCTALEWWASAKVCGVDQRAPPTFGRAAITLGIGPHSSSVVTVSKCFLSVGFGRFCRKKPRFSVRFRFS